LQVQPDSVEFHNSRGDVFAAQDNWAGAAEDYRAAVRLSPQAPTYRFSLAHALSKMGRSEEAKREYAAAFRMAPDWPEQTARMALQMCTHPDQAVRQRLSARAVQLAEQAVAADGGRRIDYLDVLALAYSEAGRFEEAAQIADLAIKLAEENGQPELAARLRERHADVRKRMPAH
jgi:tetratricopeptide (TPR) repeat protein